MALSLSVQALPFVCPLHVYLSVFVHLRPWPPSPMSCPSVLSCPSASVPVCVHRLCLFLSMSMSVHFISSNMYHHHSFCLVFCP
ncbi:hypothetical protein L210DRAFT_3534361 [Boletus edulis BED1]|uniref:Uncharacterized protein n=1 Tax=Boletus edulis BED1 TaxID=1328754 RepID=A0AAD4BY20_BOLED|nr:hypothetical protein L210DRAFT_3534361 [Boletus edulis BED1]